MTLLFQRWATVTIIVKRLLRHPVLTLATILGWVITIAIVMTIPLYAEAINYKILLNELQEQAETTRRPPFAYRYSYLGSLREPVEWEAVEPLDSYLYNEAGRALGLPQRQVISHFETNTYKLFPRDTTNYESIRQQLGIISFALTRDIASYIEIIEGTFPLPIDPDTEAPVPVLVTEAFARETGLQVGETYIAFNHRRTSSGADRQIPVQVAGIWRAVDPQDEFWFYELKVFDDLLLVPEATYQQRLSPILEDEVRLAVWTLLMDGQRVDTTDVQTLLSRASQVHRQIERFLPGTSASTTPESALSRYREAVRIQTLRLLTFSTPILGLLLAFISLIAALTVQQRLNEFAIMRGRGATRQQLVEAAVIEGLILGVVALGLGAGIALWLTSLVGQTRSFLDFSIQADLRIILTPLSFLCGVGAILMGTLAQIIPTFYATGQTIIDYKQTQSRSVTAPWWQQKWLDLGLLLLVFYAFDQLRLQEAFRLPWEDNNGGYDPFQNPALFLLPSLGILALTLIVIRALPVFLRIIGWLLRLSGSTGTLLAVRHLSQTLHRFTIPFVLLVMMVSLGVFTASISRTIDIHLIDQSFYRSGSDMSLTPDPWLTGEGTGTESGAEQTGSSRPASYFQPTQDYEAIPGVLDVTRVGRYQAQITLGSARVRGLFVGVDRAEFGQVAFWRSDFSDAQLGGLLNRLAGASNNVLVSRDFVQAYDYTVGDTVNIVVKSGEIETALTVQIVGLVDYFPSWYPDTNGTLIVGNLDYFFSQVGGQLAHTLWLTRNPEQLNKHSLRSHLETHNIPGQVWRVTEEQIEDEQNRPERQGVFGLLSVGLIATTFLTMLGLVLQVLFSFRARAIELGVLRAIGLSKLQMMVGITWEYLIIIGGGILFGSALGVILSQIMIPYFQGGPNETYFVPPFIVEIDWAATIQIVVMFSSLFAAVLLFLSFLLNRMKIFEAIKLGETI
ncbi:MAG: ABC transporter permease [Chloroflexota bacterium]